MTERHPTPDPTYAASDINRFKVERAMLELIDQLQGQGLGQAEIAMALADAAEDYVIRLASKTPESTDDCEPPWGRIQ